MEPIHRYHERFFIEYRDFKHTTAIRDSFEKLLTYVHEMRREKPYGFRLVFKPYYKKPADITVPYGSEDYDVNVLLTDWWTKISNHTMYYLMIDELIFFEEDKRIKGKIYYWNKEIELHSKIQKYYFEPSKKYEESNLFDNYVWINSRDCFYELKRFIELAVNPSEENPLLSKFEVMDAADMNKFFITMKKAESFIKKMENIVEEIKRRKDDWMFVKGNLNPLINLKEVYELLKEKFVYQKTNVKEV